MKLGTAIAEIMKREGIEILTGYPVNHLIEYAAAADIREAGGSIINVDVTIIGERPKVGPHRDEMRMKVAKFLDIPLHRVNIKATTTERLGFTGRGEGLAAQAIASVEVPTT